MHYLFRQCHTKIPSNFKITPPNDRLLQMNDNLLQLHYLLKCRLTPFQHTSFEMLCLYETDVSTPDTPHPKITQESNYEAIPKRPSSFYDDLYAQRIKNDGPKFEAFLKGGDEDGKKQLISRLLQFRHVTTSDKSEYIQICLLAYYKEYILKFFELDPKDQKILTKEEIDKLADNGSIDNDEEIMFLQIWLE